MKQTLTLAALALLVVASCKKNEHLSQSKGVVTTAAVSAITANSAVSGGSITSDGNSSITQRGVVWAIHAQPTLADSVVTNAGGINTSWTSNLTKLNANTTYHIRAFATNAQGTAYGNEINFKTTVGLATLTTSPVSEIGALSAKVGGVIINDGGASITERGIVWATTTNPTVNDAKLMINTVNSTEPYSGKLRGLILNMVYYVRAYATNSHGTAYGKEVSFNSGLAGTMIDIDGNAYPIVVIGTQTWMAANLRTSRYRNGDTIVNGMDGFDWATYSDIGAYTFPNKNDANDHDYGKLYNYAAAQDSRLLCPAGWHLPSDEEWKTLEMHEGMSQVDADIFSWRGAIGEKFLEGGSTGFEVKKSGYLNIWSSLYYDFERSGYFWSDSTIYRGFNVIPYSTAIYREDDGTNYAFPIRCVKD